MIKKNWLGLFAAATLALSFTAACGGDDGDGDGNTPDAMDEPCVGHGCPGIDSPFQLGEGGEFRMEVIRTDDTDTDSFVAGQAFFFKDQVPSFRALGPDEVFATAANTECFDFRRNDFFDNGATPEAQAIVDTRTYYDAGETATLTSGATGFEFVMLPSEDNIDDSAGLLHDVLYENNDVTQVENNVAYAPSIAGSAELPGLDLGDGEAVTGEEWGDLPVELFMPPAWDVVGGVVADTSAYFAGVTLDPAADALFQWTNAEATNPAAPSQLAFIGVFNNDGGVDFYCFTPDTMDGEITLPAAVISEMDPDGGLLLGKFAHIAWENRLDGTRIDLLGVECKFAGYTTAAP
jgi:hypothetical protein